MLDLLGVRVVRPPSHSAYSEQLQHRLHRLSKSEQEQERGRLRLPFAVAHPRSNLKGVKGEAISKRNYDLENINYNIAAARAVDRELNYNFGSNLRLFGSGRGLNGRGAPVDFIWAEFQLKQSHGHP